MSTKEYIWSALSHNMVKSSAYADVLDRVLDKGIVIDAWKRMAAGGIDLLVIRTRVIVFSIETYLPKPVFGY